MRPHLVESCNHAFTHAAHWMHCAIMPFVRFVFHLENHWKSNHYYVSQGFVIVSIVPTYRKRVSVDTERSTVAWPLADEGTWSPWRYSPSDMFRCTNLDALCPFLIMGYSNVICFCSLETIRFPGISCSPIADINQMDSVHNPTLGWLLQAYAS